ncbi:MAG: aldehyde dehydrogenase family protein [Clostridiales Family XIII bacterium]|jgi:acyl-CoA reductase-like NAD-dependent aldehyde dehydrogenase|nr:aldehyde dehydrogenase family protein [Clostridiales Family XIII bacterium]
MNIIDNDLLSIQEARILVENAATSQKTLAGYPQEKLDEIAMAIVSAITPHIERLANLSYEETDYGNVQDKYTKIRFTCDKLLPAIRDMKCVGIINRDHENKIMDVGVPMGVIAAFCPVTSPVATTIYKAVIAVKSGNAIIFSPHPRAKESMTETLDLIIEAAIQAGLPKWSISYQTITTGAGSTELMNHKDTSLIMLTGVPGLLKIAQSSGKATIIGGLGNGPAFIERTADVDRAVRDIIISKTFDYGIVTAAEQSVVVDSCIESDVRRAFEMHGGYFMSAAESDALGLFFFSGAGKANPDMVGISAQRLAKKAGFLVPDSVKVLISEQKYVSQKNPYSREKLCPVLSYFVEDDWMNACEKCIELILGERQSHTLVIHSRDEEVIKQFALKKPVGRILVNTPAVFGGMGATTNLFPAMTLGSASVGQGITSENVSPMNLVYIRKVGYGVRTAEEILYQ